MEGHWKGGQPDFPDGKGILDWEAGKFVERPEDPDSPNVGWWYMIHGGGLSESFTLRKHSWSLACLSAFPSFLDRPLSKSSKLVLDLEIAWKSSQPMRFVSRQSQGFF